MRTRGGASRVLKYRVRQNARAEQQFLDELREIHLQPLPVVIETLTASPYLISTL